MPKAVKPGKYDHVLTNLQPLPPADLSYQEKVDQKKEQFTDRHAVTLAENYLKWRIEQERIQKMMSEVNLHIEALEQLLAESQDAQTPGWGAYGVKENALRLPSGVTVRVQPEPYGQVKDKEAFRRWCIANGYETKLQLWPSTMNAIVKERLLVGQPEPDGCEAFVKTKIVLTIPGGE